MKRFVIGILAHVDAGKTTMSEAILYETGKLKKMGRVDNRDAFLDTFALERARGITIFSKQAVFPLGDTFVTLLDTPGHVDFSAEMERTLQVLDYAVLIVSGADGVQGHTETLWRLLRRYGIPVFLFVNKMDQKGTDQETVLASLKERLDHGVVDFSGVSGNEDVLTFSSSAEPFAAVCRDPEETAEEIATCDEELLEAYLADGTLKTDDVRKVIHDRKLFPCFFGSALKLTGVREFLTSLGEFASCPDYTKDFGAKVFKISRDETGVRMTHLKITGGALKIRDSLSPDSEEKINQIRLYSGSKFELLKDAEPGMVVAVTGISDTKPGQVFGTASDSVLPLLEPVLTYRILLPFGTDSHTMLKNMRILEEEDPQLHIVWNEALGEIQAQVMGDVQMEILKSQVQDRFGVEIGFGEGNIVYKETIAKTAEGVGHFEPLRHYAEVHLLMEPGEPGSGLVFEADCSEDMLDRNWQRLILTHLEEKRFRGILTGSEITDMKITLIAGRAHQKHTEGGDFRQATYRAVRQGLCEAGCVLLEPYYAFRLEVPSENLGRAMADLGRMQGEFSAPEQDGSMALLTGTAPVSTMRNYQRDVISYTKGRGRLTLSLSGYEPCHNAEEVIAASGYDFDSDLQDPAGSVFCSHGAGFVVPRMIQYGTSAPSFTPRSISSFFVNPSSNIRFTPTKTAAASVLPPAMPAATGIYLRIFMVTPSLIPFSSRSSFAARHARFPSPSGTNGRFVSVLITPSSVRSISIRSYRFTVCMIMRTSWYPSSLFRTTSRPRLILAYALRSKWSFMLSPSIFSTRESYHRNASHSQEQI